MTGGLFRERMRLGAPKAIAAVRLDALAVYRCRDSEAYEVGPDFKFDAVIRFCGVFPGTNLRFESQHSLAQIDMDALGVGTGRVGDDNDLGSGLENIQRRLANETCRPFSGATGQVPFRFANSSVLGMPSAPPFRIMSYRHI